MPEIPVLRYTCKHAESKKIINREYFHGRIITCIELCKECSNNPIFSEKIDNFKDTKITKQSKKKSLTMEQLKKAIKKRRDEIRTFEKEISGVWHESDKLDRIGKLLERYMEICQLHDDLEHLNENYIKKIQNR